MPDTDEGTTHRSTSLIGYILERTQFGEDIFSFGFDDPRVIKPIAWAYESWLRRETSSVICRKRLSYMYLSLTQRIKNDFLSRRNLFASAARVLAPLWDQKVLDPDYMTTYYVATTLSQISLADKDFHQEIEELEALANSSSENPFLLFNISSLHYYRFRADVDTCLAILDNLLKVDFSIHPVIFIYTRKALMGIYSTLQQFDKVTQLQGELLTETDGRVTTKNIMDFPGNIFLLRFPDINNGVPLVVGF